MTTLTFDKMHGLGNDFVVVDGRRALPPLSREARRALADRHRGVGCDQLIVLEPSARADLFMRIYNPDGGEAEACGNATRCVAQMTGGDVVVETRAGLLVCRRDGEDIEVDMGPVRTGWDDVPLATAQADTARVDVAVGPLNGPACCNIGNPHASFFVMDVDAVEIEALGPLVERHPLFPEGVNVGFVEVRSPNELRFKVWERGTGITQACGSGACAALAGAVRRGFAERRARVVLDGGALQIAYRESDDHVLMQGPAAHVFRGELDLEEVIRGHA